MWLPCVATTVHKVRTVQYTLNYIFCVFLQYTFGTYLTIPLYSSYTTNNTQIYISRRGGVFSSFQDRPHTQYAPLSGFFFFIVLILRIRVETHSVAFSVSDIAISLLFRWKMLNTHPMTAVSGKQASVGESMAELLETIEGASSSDYRMVVFVLSIVFCLMFSYISFLLVRLSHYVWFSGMLCTNVNVRISPHSIWFCQTRRHHGGGLGAFCCRFVLDKRCMWWSLGRAIGCHLLRMFVGL